MFAEIKNLSLDERPQRLAEVVHEFQKDKSGAEYIDHPKRVAQNAKILATRLTLESKLIESALAVAWLHDVIEDSADEPLGAVTEKDLIDMGFSSETIGAVVLLTRIKGEKDKSAYYRRLNNNHLARLVKIADVADNRNFERRADLSPSDASYFERKYAHALELLQLNETELEFYEKRIHLPIVLNQQAEEELAGL